MKKVSFRQRACMVVAAAAAICDPSRSDAQEPAAAAGEATTERVVIEGIRERGQTGPTATRSTTATRIDVNPRQVPQSVGVATSELLEEIGAKSAGDLAYLVGGVSRQAWDGWNSGLVVRGFEIQSNGLIDGLRQPRVSGRTSTTSIEDIALFERVEILKGHSSVLYGRGWPGGTVNFITRKPLFESRASVEALAGSEDDYLRVVVDVTGPLDETIAFRVIGIAQQHAPSGCLRRPGSTRSSGSFRRGASSR